MQVELVRATTRDGLRLDGALALPREDSKKSISVDGFLLLHGVGGTFFGGNLFPSLLTPLLELGAAVLRVNTRGYGSVNMIASTGGAGRYGAAFEIVDECRHDIHGWIDLLVERGMERIGVVGHSLGAIKAAYCAARDPHPNLACLIAASPPRLSCQAFENSERSSEFRESLETARGHVESGCPERLFTARFPVPILISAASYLDKYGPGERYNILEFVDRVRCPSLFTYGERELEHGGVAFEGLPEAIRRRVPGGEDSSAAADSKPSPVSIVTIPGADHFYTGKYEQLASAMVDWLQSDGEGG